MVLLVNSFSFSCMSCIHWARLNKVQIDVSYSYSGYAKTKFVICLFCHWIVMLLACWLARREAVGEITSVAAVGQRSKEVPRGHPLFDLGFPKYLGIGRNLEGKEMKGFPFNSVLKSILY